MTTVLVCTTLFCQKLDDVSKTEYVKKGMQMTEELGKTAGKAAESITKTGQAIGQSAPVQVVSLLL